MKNQFNRFSNSINAKLFVPLLVVFVLAVGFFYVVVQHHSQQMVEKKLSDRAFELAESFAVATGIDSSQSNLVRVINSIGAYDDINKLILLDDSTSIIVAASKNRYTKSAIKALDDPQLQAQLRLAIATMQSTFLDGDYQGHYFAYKMYVLSGDKGKQRTMTLFMDIDVSNTKAFIQSINGFFFTALLGLLTTVALLSFMFIRNIVLAPIYKLVDSIKNTKRQNRPVVSQYASVDELGVLTKVYNELILDSFAKQRELSKEREISEQALLAKSQFLAMMTHELRTPLNGVIGMSGKLAELVNEPTQYKYVEVIQLSAQQLLGTINDTLDFSKIEAGMLVLDIQPFDLIATLKNVVAMFELQLEQKAVALNFQAPEQSLRLLDGDSVRLSQVVINLLGNAVKFTDKGSIDVTVGIVSQDNATVGLTISVRDSGIGLSAEQIDSLFSEFTQADSSTTRKYGGTGLGLWISKKLIDKMKGKIGVKSEVGEGSDFTIELTLDVSKQTALAQKTVKLSQKPEDYIHSPINILLVEDTEINRMVVMAILDKPNMHFSIAENGLEAVNLFEQSEFDLILMDCLMPVMDGFEASRQIRQIEQQQQRHQQTPIIALTANALEDTRKECLDAGMNEFLAKPIVAELLHQTLEKWIRK
ncbi:MAG: ATP-binding protein [Psychrosphaera sp.]|nr:ATP-binding protein [Psychrosphaera sp.]